MGRPWVPVPLASVPKELRKFVDGLNEWARDKDRLEASLSKPIDTSSASASIALNKEFAVDSTRVGNTDRATFNPLDVVGSLVPSTDASFDIGQPTGPPKRWRDAWFSRNIDGNGNLDIQGNGVFGGDVTAGGTLSTSGAIVVTGGTADITGNVRVIGNFGVSGLITSSLYPSEHIQWAVGELGSSAWYQVNSWEIRCSNLFAGVSISGGGAEPFGIDVDYGGIRSTHGSTLSECLGTSKIINSFSLWSGTTFGCGATAQILGGLTVTGMAQVGGVLTVDGAADIAGNLGVTGFAMVAGGVSTPGGITVGGVVRLGSTMTVGTVNIDPVTTNTGALGRAARRWGNIFGSSGNFTNLTVGSSLNVTSGIANLFNLVVTGGATFSGTVAFGNGVAQDLAPTSDNLYDLGSPNLRWQELSLSGTAYLSKGADLASGTTVTLAADGNYFDVTGTNTIGGISTPAIANGNTLFLPGTPVILRFDGAAKMQNGTHQSLLAGVTFVAAAGDHLGLIVDSTNSAGRPNFREMFRWRADGVRRQSTDTNKSMGRATLVAGITTVANTSVTANSNIFLTVQTIGGFMGVLGITNVSAGASFGISSSSNADTSTIAWEIVEPEGV